MVAGVKRYLERLQIAVEAKRDPSPAKLADILGVSRDVRLENTTPFTLVAPGAAVDLWRHEKFIVRRVRWPVLEGITGEGLLFSPIGKLAAHAVVIPDAGDPPEASSVAPQLASAGCEVLVLTLIDLARQYSGNPAVRIANQTHREFLYRMLYPLGRHLIGLEVHKVLAAIDWFRKRDQLPIAVWGEREGAGIAQFAAALDERIGLVYHSAYPGLREDLWAQPIYRNVWGLLKDFGPQEMRRMLRGRLVDSLEELLERLELKAPPPALVQRVPWTADAERQKRQVQETMVWALRILELAERQRTQLWSKPVEVMRYQFHQRIVGELPPSRLAPNVRSRLLHAQPRFTGYEVAIDVVPDVFAYGILLVPRGLKDGERRPLVVAQHGLEGRPQDLVLQGPGRALDVYQNLGQTLVERGFIVYLPQNPYIGEFRPINRLANPLGLSMFAFIKAQHEAALAWLKSLPFVDSYRIGFYGLSYGGTTALRLGPLLGDYSVVICSGNFNEWIRKLIHPDWSYSYLYAQEYEIYEFDLANIAGHAEMARMIAPRPFLVERGHRDGVGVDEWVAYEYAKVRRFYVQAGLGERTGIAWFDGPHRIDGREAIPFLERWLGFNGQAGTALGGPSSPGSIVTVPRVIKVRLQ